MTVSKIASTDTGYVTGDISLYPQAIDDKFQLYEATNNSQTTLKQSCTYNGKYLIVEDNDNFPNKGLLKIGPAAGEIGPYEIIYYENKSSGVFKDLIRGFAGTKQNPWPVGSYVCNAVFSEHHNAIKDAIIQIEKNLGVKSSPNEESLNGILKKQENRFLAPRPLFNAFPTIGAPPLTVTFQNFSTGPLVRYLWDFGDGSTSIEKSPTHTYIKEGIYTVKLNIITTLGAHGIVTKSNYITIDEEEKLPFFYVTPYQGYSKKTALELTNQGIPTEPTEFTFVDQTDGNIIQRYWVFDGDGERNGEPVENQSVPEINPNIHSTTYVYDVPGEYEPTLLILFESQKLKRVFLKDKITVI